MREEDFQKLSLPEKIQRLERDIEALEGDDMRSIAYSQSLYDKAQKGVEVLEQMYQPIVLHAEHMLKQLSEKEQKLSSTKVVLRVFEDQFKKQPTKKEKNE